MSLRLRAACALIAVLTLSSAAHPQRVAPVAGATRGAYVDGPWGQIHVRVAGPERGPTVLLLHMMVWSSAQFERVQPLLAARGIRSIAVDMPGYGKSDTPSSLPTANEYAAALLPVLDAFKVRRAVVVGFNTGNTLGVALAATHPERVSALVINGAWINDPARPAAPTPHRSRTPQPDGSHLLETWSRIDSNAKRGILSPALLHSMTTAYFEAGPRYWYGHDANIAYDLLAGLRRTRMPGAVVSFPGGNLETENAKLMAVRPDLTPIPIATGKVSIPVYDAPELWTAALARYVLAQRR